MRPGEKTDWEGLLQERLGPTHAAPAAAPPGIAEPSEAAPAAPALEPQGDAAGRAAALEEERRRQAEREALRHLLLAQERAAGDAGRARRATDRRVPSDAPPRRVGLVPLIALAIFVLAALAFLIWSVMRMEARDRRAPAGAEPDRGGGRSPRSEALPEPAGPGDSPGPTAADETPAAEPEPAAPTEPEAPALPDPRLDPEPTARP